MPLHGILGGKRMWVSRGLGGVGALRMTALGVAALLSAPVSDVVHPAKADRIVQHRRADPPRLQPYAKLSAPGSVIALSGDGDTALVGREGDAVVFVRSGGSWASQATLQPPGAVEGDAFGCSMALSADGDTALIGAPGREADRSQAASPSGAWVFTREGRTWTPQAKLDPPEQPGVAEPLGCGAYSSGEGKGNGGGFGSSVALSADGDIALVAAPGGDRYAGAVWPYGRTGSGWTQQGPKLAPPERSAGALFGSSLAISADGNTALVGAPADIPTRCRNTGTSAGGIWTFTRAAGTWTQQGARLGLGRDCEGRFGSSISLSADGDTALAVGQWGAWPLAQSGAGWSLQKSPGLPCIGDECGFIYGFHLKVALSGDGQVALVRATPGSDCGKYMNELCGERGLTWAFHRFDATWVQQDARFEEPAGFGSGVALSNAGDSALIAAEAGGADAYLIPPPPPGSFSIAGLHAKRSGLLRQQIASSTAGTFTATAMVSRGGLRLSHGPAHHLILYGRGEARVSGPGLVTVKIEPRRLVRRALLEHRSIEPELHIAISFRPHEETASVRKTLTVALERH